MNTSSNDVPGAGTPGEDPRQGPGQPGGPYGGPPPSAPYPSQPQDASNARLWATATHWGALVAWFATSGVLAFLAPLLILTTVGRTSPVVRRNAVTSLNFQLSLLIYEVVTAVVLVIGILLSFILVGIPIAIVAGVALLALVVGGIVLPIIASVKASNDEEYTYPLTLPLVS